MWFRDLHLAVLLSHLIAGFEIKSLKAVNTLNRGKSLQTSNRPPSSLFQQNTGRFTLPPLFGILSEIESQAVKAVETWSIEATHFLEPTVAADVEKRFQDRIDVVSFRVAGGRRLPVDHPQASSGEARRSRFIFTHPDLGFDMGTAESEYCTVIRVDNVDIGASNTLPNALGAIGVNLHDVGDIVIIENSTVYLVVDPNVAKQCLRLLSKELAGVGISLSIVGDNEFMPHGVFEEMKLSRLVERQLKRKQLDKGYVQFG